MPDVGVPELLIILVIVLLVFGAGRLTEIMGALGRGVAEFRKGSETGQSDSNVKKDGTTKLPPTTPVR